MSSLTLPTVAERARLSIHCLTQHGDAARGGLPYFYTFFSDRPAVARLVEWSYSDGLGRGVSAMALLRCLLGEGIDEEADRRKRAALLGLTGADGLSWIPAEPWTRPVPFADLSWGQRGHLLALATLYAITEREDYRRAGEHTVRTLLDHLREGRWPGAQNHVSWLDGEDTVPRSPENPSWNAVSHAAALIFYRRTGYAPALELGSELIDLVLKHSDGGERLFTKGHFHTDSQFLLGLALRGAITGSASDLELAERLYAKALALGTSSGWFPERLGSEVSETCCLVDMIEAAVVLARHADARYWADIERFSRNFLMVHQITSTDWMHDLDPAISCAPAERGEGFVTGDHLLEPLIGGYAGYGAVSSFCYATSQEPHHAKLSNSNQHCCNAAGGRALYAIWRYGVEDDGARVSIHLHLHRRHPVFDLVVEEDEDRLALHITLREARALRIRLPEGVNFAEARFSGLPEGIAPRVTPDGTVAYLALPTLPAGTKLIATFPQPARTTREHAGRQDYEFHWRGATVVHAEPLLGTPELFTPARFLSAPPELSGPYGREVESL